MYCAYVTTLKNVRKAENSDRLYLAECYGEGVIVGPNSADGDKVLYLPQDGQIERWFGDAFKLFRKNTDGSIQGGYIENNGHIRAIKLRGNRSEGIVIPISKIYSVFGYQSWNDGQEVISIFVDGKEKRFCKKYIPKQTDVYHMAKKTSYKGRKAEGVIYPEFSMHSDTQQLAYNMDAFKPGDKINITLKMHGTSQRSMMTYGELPNSWFRRLFHMKKKTKPAYVLGTRRTVIHENSTGYYGTDTFRFPHHEALAPFIEDGMEVFYEVVGYYGPQETQTIMPICNNAKINDKNFVKQYGDTTTFNYGCTPGHSAMWIYRITSDNGRKEWTPDEITEWCNIHNFNRVPVVDDFEFTTAEDLQNRINAYFEDLTDPIGKTHIKEGVVVRIVNRPRFEAYKSKTVEFKILEGLIKDSAKAPDMEEAQELEVNDN
jgi:hypothetical protein